MNPSAICEHTIPVGQFCPQCNAAAWFGGMSEITDETYKAKAKAFAIAVRGLQRIAQESDAAWVAATSTLHDMEELVEIPPPVGPIEVVRVALSPNVEASSWLNDPEWLWLRDLYEYATTQTRAIPVLAKITPEEFGQLLCSALHGAPGLYECASGGDSA